MTAVPLPDKVIVIGGLPRSGKTILSGTLGSHSQIAIPESALNFFHYFSDHNYSARGGFDQNLDYFFQSCRKSKSWGVTRDMVSNSGSNRRDLYLVLLETFRKSHFPDKKYVGEFTHTTEENFDVLVAWFGLERLRVLQIIRDPYDNYASWVVARNVSRSQRETQSHSAPVHKFCNTWAQSAAMGMARTLRYPRSYRTLFFDQIKEDPRGFVESLCEWLGVPAEVEPMLNMVDQQKTWNSVFGAESEPGDGVGFVRKDTRDRRKHLSGYEIDTIQAMSCPNMPFLLGYEQNSVAIHWKTAQTMDSKKFSSSFRLMVRSHLSPLSPRQVAVTYLQQTLEAVRFLASSAADKFLRRPLGRRGSRAFEETSHQE